jgi:hypothetical protein
MDFTLTVSERSRNSQEHQRGLTRSLHSLSSQNTETLLLLILLTPHTRRGPSLFFPPSQPEIANAVLRHHPKGKFFTPIRRTST